MDKERKITLITIFPLPKRNCTILFSKMVIDFYSKTILMRNWWCWKEDSNTFTFIGDDSRSSLYSKRYGRFKANLSNVMDILGRLTSKFHETIHIAYKHYNNSYKDLISSWNTHKHIWTHIRHRGDLDVERLSHPLDVWLPNHLSIL